MTKMLKFTKAPELKKGPKNMIMIQVSLTSHYGKGQKVVIFLKSFQVMVRLHILPQMKILEKYASGP